MYYPLLLLSLLLSFTSCSYSQNTIATLPTPDYYPVPIKGQWGYINASGKVVIPPRFHVAQPFSEDLAVVREKDTYGFIDAAGHWAIPPQYHYATPFVNGIARVALRDSSYFIDKNGVVHFKCLTEAIEDLPEEGILILKQAQQKTLLDRKGTILFNPPEFYFGSFYNGRAIASFVKVDSITNDSSYQKGLINTKGEWIFTLNDYRQIWHLDNGYLEVEKGEDAYVLNPQGRVLFKLPKDQIKHLSNPQFNEGLGKVTVEIPDSIDRHRDAKGFIDTAGHILFYKEAWWWTTPFKHSRAFVYDTDNDWQLIDPLGNPVTSSFYKAIAFDWREDAIDDLFVNGQQLVHLNGKWILIDKMGKLLQNTPSYFDEYEYASTEGHFVIFKKSIALERIDQYSCRDIYQYGFWNRKTNEWVKAQFDNLNFSNPDATLLPVWKNKQLAYINQSGQYIWRSKSKTPPTLNIDYKNYTYCYAATPPDSNYMGLGGWGKSQNIYQTISKPNQFPAQQLSLVVQPKHKALFKKKYQGMKLYLANSSPDTCFFLASDSRLYIKLQAKDSSGNWRDIEQHLSSWCGNSYHTLYLPSQHYWEFVLPKYSGSFQTQLRAKLVLYDEDDQEKLLYSAPFQGSINPSQFWRKKPYQSNNLMDPYYN